MNAHDLDGDEILVALAYRKDDVVLGGVGGTLHSTVDSDHPYDPVVNVSFTDRDGNTASWRMTVKIEEAD